MEQLSWNQFIFIIYERIQIVKTDQHFFLEKNQYRHFVPIIYNNATLLHYYFIR